MLVNIYMKFHEDILYGFQVTERARFCDGQTDGRTGDGRTDDPGKNNMSSLPLINNITWIQAKYNRRRTSMQKKKKYMREIPSIGVTLRHPSWCRTTTLVKEFAIRTFQPFKNNTYPQKDLKNFGNAGLR